MAIAVPEAMKTLDRTALDELTDLVNHGEPEAVLAYRPSPEAHARLYALIDREKSGHISETEQQELNRCMELDHLLRMAKIRARVRIQERDKAA